jgi:flagellar basal-body rod modification protein FlgD
MGIVSNVASSAAAASSASGNQQLSLASNFNTFLTLLTTQLKNQSPTSPADSSQFTQQLVEFAGVQQQVQSNTLLQQLVTATQANQVASASSYIGTTIQATGNSGGLTNGLAEFGYNLASTAANAQVTISDSSGNIVFEGSGPTSAGDNLVKWDGKNSFTGQTEPNGAYTISVKATDASGNAVSATPFVTGVVDSASISNGTVVLDVNGLQVPVSSITKVSNLPGTTTASSGSGTSSTSGSGKSS